MTVPERTIGLAGRLPVALSRAADHGKLWIVVAGGLALSGGSRRRAAVRGLGSLAASSFLANVVLKSRFHRARPSAAPGSLVGRVRKPVTSSFPSGHSASAAAFATGAAIEVPALGPPLALLAIGVAWSRVRVGVHRPTEVIAGASLGIAVALTTMRLLRPGKVTAAGGACGGEVVVPGGGIPTTREEAACR
jgi:membrane-associated phospholipid phosphatase